MEKLLAICGFLIVATIVSGAVLANHLSNIKRNEFAISCINAGKRPTMPVRDSWSCN